MNVAVTKINTREEYKKHLPETRKQLGTCPGCSQTVHSYTRQFPFGTADWPSSRLDACPKFQSMSPRECGELIEMLKGCYICTAWQHQGDKCYTRTRSSCNVVSAGVACGGAHHKLLHGSGVAFCHKIMVQVSNTGSFGLQQQVGEDAIGLPDINQPVLLEVQKIMVHGVSAKVMFDNGSTAALVTHSYAEKAGLRGERISYWLVIV